MMTEHDEERPLGGFHVQGRRTWRNADGTVHDDVRLADTDTRSDAFRVANGWRRDGFTIWVWEKADLEISPDLSLVGKLRPSSREHPT